MQAIRPEHQIQYALALDLDRRPRLSRTNAGMFNILYGSNGSIIIAHLLCTVQVLYSNNCTCMGFAFTSPPPASMPQVFFCIMHCSHNSSWPESKAVLHRITSGACWNLWDRFPQSSQEVHCKFTKHNKLRCTMVHLRATRSSYLSSNPFPRILFVLAFAGLLLTSFLPNQDFCRVDNDFERISSPPLPIESNTAYYGYLATQA